ncbi:short-chain dehydrogenase [Virgibacillus sp. JSM 102003]|uniref:short-chain dehydrogenase n=1 Tax=Virgibacillus sp. JSM 102003 TaxID=1562108 RepID=UPI0035C2599C
MKNRYALVVGGTGMLKDVCHWLIEQEYHVYVIGRDQTKLKKLEQEATQPENLHGISVDYQNSTNLSNELSNLFESNGIPDIVVSWIHSTAPQALPLIKDMISKQDLSTDWRLIHIQGSARFFEKENTPVPENCLYRRVYLGFILENNLSRWLTHNEISDGVIHAITTDNNETIVGTLEPWDMRP